MDSIYSDNPISAAAEHLTMSIKDHLAAGQKVFWFLSGGSGIQVVLQTARQLVGTDLTNLYVTLSDERYGNVGHPDENWQQLLDGGMDLPGATLYRTLIDEDRSTTTDLFGAWIMQHMMSADYKIGLFGIGSDGHTAGIKPHSSAVDASAWADHFDGDDFERITITPSTIRQLDEIVFQVSANDKAPIIDDLLHRDVDLAQQPAQILKAVPKCTLYTNLVTNE